MSKLLHYSDGIVTKQNIFENLNAVNPDTNELKNPPQPVAKNKKPKKKKKAPKPKANKENSVNNVDTVTVDKGDGSGDKENANPSDVIEDASGNGKEDATSVSAETKPVENVTEYDPASDPNPIESSLPTSEAATSNDGVATHVEQVSSSAPPVFSYPRYGYPTMQFVNSALKKRRFPPEAEKNDGKGYGIPKYPPRNGPSSYDRPRPGTGRYSGKPLASSTAEKSNTGGNKEIDAGSNSIGRFDEKTNPTKANDKSKRSSKPATGSNKLVKSIDEKSNVTDHREKPSKPRREPRSKLDVPKRKTEAPPNVQTHGDLSNSSNGLNSNEVSLADSAIPPVNPEKSQEREAKSTDVEKRREKNRRQQKKKKQAAASKEETNEQSKENAKSDSECSGAPVSEIKTIDPSPGESSLAREQCKVESDASNQRKDEKLDGNKFGESKPRPHRSGGYGGRRYGRGEESEREGKFPEQRSERNGRYSDQKNERDERYQDQQREKGDRYSDHRGPDYTRPPLRRFNDGYRRPSSRFNNERKPYDEKSRAEDPKRGQNDNNFHRMGGNEGSNAHRGMNGHASMEDERRVDRVAAKDFMRRCNEQSPPLMNGSAEFHDNTRDANGKTKKWSDESWQDDDPRKPSPYEEQTNRVKVTHERVEILDSPRSLNQTIQEVSGDILGAPMEYSLAIGVSEDFRMPSGPQAQFRNEFKRLDILLDQNVRVGGVASLSPPVIPGTRHVFYLIHKKLSHLRSSTKSLQSCLHNLRAACLEKGVRNLALPQLGMGHDKLDWREVRPLLDEVFESSGINVLVYMHNEDIDYGKNLKPTGAKLLFETKPVVQIEEFTSIVVLSSLDRDLSSLVLDSLNAKFSFLSELDSQLSAASLGSVISFKRGNYFINIFIVSRTAAETFKFETMFKCLSSYKKHLNKDRIEYVAFEALTEPHVEFLNEKLVSFMKNSLLYSIQLHVCWPEYVEDRHGVARTKPNHNAPRHEPNGRSHSNGPSFGKAFNERGFQNNGKGYSNDKGFHNNTMSQNTLEIDSNRHFPKL